MRYMLDTNIVSDLIRSPQGKIADRIARVGEDQVGVSVVVAAELRFGAAKKKSARLSAQLEAILNSMDVLALEPPVDAIYGHLRADLEHRGKPIGANDLLIAAHALAMDLTLVTDNVEEFRRVPKLRVENWLR